MLKTSLLITGDASVARKEVSDLAQSVKDLGAGSAAAAPQIDKLSDAERGAAASSLDVAAAAGEMTRAQTAAAASARSLGEALDASEAAQLASIASARQGAVAQGVLTTSMSELAAQARQLGTVLGALSTSADTAGARTRAAGAGVTEYDTALARLRASIDPAAEAQRRLAQAIDLLDTALSRGDITNEEYAIGLKQATAASRGLAEGHARLGASGAIMQHVVRSTTDSFVAGLPISMIFGEQIGRVGEAAALSGGALGALGGVMAGPLGIALTALVSVGGVLISKLLETESASDIAKAALERITDTQKNLASAIDKTNGKLAEQNRLQALAGSLAAPTTVHGGRQTIQANINEAFKDAQDVLASMSRGRGGYSGQGLALSRILTAARGTQYGATTNGRTSTTTTGNNFETLVRGVNALAETSGDKAVGKLAGNLNDLFSSATRTYGSIKQLQGAQRDANITLAGGAVLTQQSVAQEIALATAHDGVTRAQAKLAGSKAVLDALFEKPSSAARDAQIRRARGQVVADTNAVTAAQEAAKKKPKPKKPADTTAFTAGVSNDIASALAQFTDAPTFIEKARVATARLDKDIAELQKKKPPNFQPLIDQATAAKGVIQANLTKPYDDFIKAQQQQFQILQLQAAGRNDEADALKTVFAQQKLLGPLDQAHRDGILASVEALRAEQREVDNLRAKNAKYIEALGGIKSVVDEATQAFVRGDLGQLMKSPGKLLDVFQTLQGKALFDKVFGGLFTELEDQVNGTSVVKDAAAVMASAVDTTSGSIAQLGQAASSVAAALAYGPGSAEALLAKGNGSPPEVDINGNSVVTVAGRSGNSITRDPAALIERALGGIGTSIAKAFTDPTTAASIGKTFGKYGGEALQGAATGSLVAGIGKSLGLNLSGSGAQLGGALGGLLGDNGILGKNSPITKALGPFSSLLTPALGVVGGLLGSLFGSVKYGGATITSKGVQGTVGNDSGAKAQGVTAGNAVLSSLKDILDQLGGTDIGDFGTITVGKYKDKYRVNDHGTNLKSNNDVLQYDTLEEAQSFALDTALARGAIKGISTAVQKALTDPAVGDVSSRLKEALKVEDLQVLIGGVQASLKKIFDTEANTAKERLRLAQTYGLDVAATEKANADQMTKLLASTLKTATGSLQSVLDDLDTGSLFEGSAADRRGALLGKIADAKTRADAGEDGASDELATLYRNLLSTSKDAYGTAGPEYSADRTAVSTGAVEVIKAEKDRINAAAGIQAKIADNTAATAQLVDETNDLLASIKAGMGGISTGGAGDSGVIDAPLANYRLTKIGQDT